MAPVIPNIPYLRYELFDRFSQKKGTDGYTDGAATIP